MTLKIIFRNLFYKPLSTILSVTLLMLGTGIISLILLLQNQLQQKFDNDLKDIDLVIGAKGSPLQLVLSSVYHVDAPTGNIKIAEVNKLLSNPLVEQAVPLAYGDSYKGVRIVGTDSNYLLKYEATFNKGKLFAKAFDVVVGANVASNYSLGLDSLFVGTHGLGEGGDVHKAFKYKVVGILNPTNTVLDNLILTPIESVWMVHHHEAEEKKESLQTEADSITIQEKNYPSVANNNHPPHHAEPPTTDRPEDEITAMLIKFRSPMGIMTMPRIINETTNMQAAVPTLEMNRLFNLLGIGITTFQAIALAIILVSGFSVFIALYNRLKERKYEMALMRSMGSSRSKLYFIITAEAMFLSLSGFILGIGLSRVGLWLIATFSGGNLKMVLPKANFETEEWYLLFICLGIGLLASFIPAAKAYRLNISNTLSNE